MTRNACEQMLRLAVLIGCVAAARARADEPFSATATVEAQAPNARSLDPDEVRSAPGALGDPFRAVGLLPGVTPLASGLPYIYVRGAPPASTLYYYDEVPLPALFHVALGPAVIHPAMLGPIRLYGGVAPARYGRHTGGVITGDRRVFDDSQTPAFGELELRTIDINGLLYAPLGAGGITVAGRYGYPGPIVSAFSPDVNLSYWDYQLQLREPLDRGVAAEVSAFGAYDQLRSGFSDFESTFHRLDLRLLREAPNWQYGAGILLGYDATSSNATSTLFSRISDVQTERIAPRLWLSYRGDGLRLRVGADMAGVAGKLSGRPEAQIFPQDTPSGTAAGSAAADDIYASAAARNAMGAYAELALLPLPQLETAFGARADVWLTGSEQQAAVDPRVLVTYWPTAGVDLHVGAGINHQPAVFLLPLPGVADIALARGLQRALQAETGVGIDVGTAARAELQLYVHHYSDLLFPELTLQEAARCAELSVIDVTLCEGYQPFPRASALAYGAELLVRSSVRERLSGWLSYTLARADAESDAGVEFTPSFDIRHLANAVLRYRIGAGLNLGVRTFVRSGQVLASVADTGQRVERELPAFYRLDARAGYEWSPSWGRMEVSLEWMNVTLTREPLGFSCGLDITTQHRPPPDELCRVRYAPALVFPNAGVRAQF